jgi:hypothetical protein
MEGVRQEGSKRFDTAVTKHIGSHHGFPLPSRLTETATNEYESQSEVRNKRVLLDLSRHKQGASQHWYICSAPRKDFSHKRVLRESIGGSQQTSLTRPKPPQTRSLPALVYLFSPKKRLQSYKTQSGV